MLGLGGVGGLVAAIVIWWITFGRDTALVVQANTFRITQNERAIARMDGLLSSVANRQIESLTELKSINRRLEEQHADMEKLDAQLRSQWTRFNDQFTTLNKWLGRGSSQ